MNNDTEYTYICGKCKQELPRDAYHKDPSRKGHFSICRECRAAKPDRVIEDLIGNARKRSAKKGLPCEVTREYLLWLNEQQEGKCVYTGIDLNWVNISSPNRKQRVCPPDRVSLDRIDPSKGYVPGNMQLLTDFANRIKAWYSEEQFLRYCRLIVAKFDN